MVPIYSLDSVSCVFYNQSHCATHPVKLVQFERIPLPFLKILHPHFPCNPSRFCLAVDCFKIPQNSHLCGHMQRVLRGLRHLQLHDLLAQLPGKPVSQPGVDAGGAGAAETPAPSVLLPALANGRVSSLYNTFTIRTYARTCAVLCPGYEAIQSTALLTLWKQTSHSHPFFLH